MNHGDTAVATPEADVETRSRRQPPYGVILHNDDINTFHFVIETLRKVFGYEMEKCILLTLEAHETGRSLVWCGTLEGAELKREQVLSRGADPEMKGQGALPLRVTLEEMPQ
ncbi:ATP-dependent Clp protease adaptor ClpS [bacterium]|nr:ATP-dependent Clp protease adaptor ClpS [bacterium]